MTANTIQQLGDQIASLTLSDAHELGDYLKTTHGIEPVRPTEIVREQGEPLLDEHPQPLKTHFDVILTSYGHRKLDVIRVVRPATGLALREAKSLVENAPMRVLAGCPEEEAKSLVQAIEQAGGVAELS